MKEQFPVVWYGGFGKSDRSPDYAWTFSLSVPEPVSGYGQELAALSEDGVASAGVCVTGERRWWLAALRPAGADHSDRPSVRVDIWALERAPDTLEQQLKLVAWVAEYGSSLSQGQVSIAPGNFPRELPDMEVSQDYVNRLRLQLPLSAGIQLAQLLARRLVHPVPGVLYFRRLRTAPPCVPATMRCFLSINASEEPLSQEEQELLTAARQLHEPDWQDLSRLTRDELHDAVRWACVEGGFASGPPPEYCRAWALRSAERFGGVVPAWLRMRESGQTENSLLTLLARELSPAAAAVLIGDAEPDQVTISELVRRGWWRALPLRALVRFSSDAEVSAKVVLALVEQGVPERSARILLDEAVPGLKFEEVSQVLAQGSKLDLPLPRNNVTKVLSAVHSLDRLSTLVRRLREWPGIGQLMVDALHQGAFPDIETLRPEELATIWTVRARLGQAIDPLEALRWLACQDLSTPEKRRPAVDAIRRYGGNGLSAAALAWLEAPEHGTDAFAVDEIVQLARVGLMQPTDVAPGPETLPRLARCWEQTRPLIDLLEGQAVDRLPELHAGWRPAVQRLLSPEKVTMVLKAASAERRGELARWLAELRDWPPELVEWCLGPGGVTLPSACLAPHAELLKAMLEGLAPGPRWGWLRAVDPEPRGSELEARRSARSIVPDLKTEELELTVFAWTRLGPFPPVGGVRPAVMKALLPALPLRSAVDAILSSYDTALGSDEGLAQALVDALRLEGSPAPDSYYTEAQRARHLPLLVALSHVPGWEALSPDMTARLELVERLRTRLGVKGGER